VDSITIIVLRYKNRKEGGDMKTVKAIASFAAVILLLAGCAQLEAVAESEKTPEATGTLLATSSPSPTPLATQHPTPQHTPQCTPLPSKTPIPSPTPTPTVSLETIEIEGTGVTELTPGLHYRIDSDGDGQEEILTLYEAKGESGVELKVQLGGKETGVTEDSYFISGFYADYGNGQACVMLSMDEASDDYYTNVYHIRGGETPIKTNTVLGYVEQINGTTISMVDYINVLGTYLSDCDFTLGENLKLEPAGDGLWHVGEGNYITTKLELPVEWQENDTYSAGTLASGTTIEVTVSDRLTVAYFTCKDGRKGRLYFTRGDTWYLTVNGLSEYDCFEELPYSG
jgi:hypothetical protein